MTPAAFRWVAMGFMAVALIAGALTPFPADLAGYVAAAAKAATAIAGLFLRPPASGDQP